MPGEFSDLENLSDLESLLALAEENFDFSESKNDEKNSKKDCCEIENDCEIIAVKSVSPQKPSTTVSVIKSIVSKTSLKVQKSISEFFRAPKRLPEAEIFTEIPVEKPKTVFDGKLPAKFQGKFKLPKFKLIPGTPFAVDAFSYGLIPSITGYFLTHFHSDHYKGLSSKFFEDKRVRLYCSEVTGNLVKRELRVREEVMTTLKIGNIYLIEGIHVGVLDANQ